MKDAYSLIYDSFLNNPKYAKVVTEIEHELVKYDIKGRRNRLNALNSLTAIAKQEIQKGIKNIIILGNDQSFFNILDLAVPNDVIIGLIPIGQHNNLADLFGLDLGVPACQIISQRLLKKIPIAQINDVYFFQEAVIQNINTSLKINCDDQFTIIPQIDKNPYIKIVNFNTKTYQAENELMLYITHQKSNYFFKKKTDTSAITTSVPFQKLEIKGEKSIAITVDNYKTIKTPAIFKRNNHSLQVIVGKNRKI